MPTRIDFAPKFLFCLVFFWKYKFGLFGKNGFQGMLIFCFGKHRGGLYLFVTDQLGESSQGAWPLFRVLLIMLTSFVFIHLCWWLGAECILARPSDSPRGTQAIWSDRFDYTGPSPFLPHFRIRPCSFRWFREACGCFLWSCSLTLPTNYFVFAKDKLIILGCNIFD